MPIYEYKCIACGHSMEAIQKMTDELLVNCPACNKPELQKLVSAAAFQLKGTGWYATDFKNKGKPEASTEVKSTSTSSGDGGESKDTKNTKSSSTSQEGSKTTTTSTDTANK